MATRADSSRGRSRPRRRRARGRRRVVRAPCERSSAASDRELGRDGSCREIGAERRARLSKLYEFGRTQNRTSGFGQRARDAAVFLLLPPVLAALSTSESWNTVCILRCSVEVEFEFEEAEWQTRKSLLQPRMILPMIPRRTRRGSRTMARSRRSSRAFPRNSRVGYSVFVPNACNSIVLDSRLHRSASRIRRFVSRRTMARSCYFMSSFRLNAM